MEEQAQAALGIVDAQALPETQCASESSGFAITDKWIGYDWLRRRDRMCVEGGRVIYAAVKTKQRARTNQAPDDRHVRQKFGLGSADLV